MDRELVFVVLGSVFSGVLTLLGSSIALCWRPLSDLSLPGPVLERRAALRLVAPVVPAAIALGTVIGWVLVEPEDAERLPWIALVLALPWPLVWLRATARAVLALRPTAIETAATIGLLRPRIVVNGAFAASLDAAARAAMFAHERAHVRHRDPLRVWLAQIVTDLQWPLPGAWERFEAWRAMLELSRDDEARAVVDGDDLAAAVVAAARYGGRLAAVGIAATASSALRARIERLLTALPTSQEASRVSLALPVFCVAFVAAMLVGCHFGEGLMLALCGR